MDWRKHITFNPAVCHGKACISGTRVMVSVILDNLAAGKTASEVIEAYPSLTNDAVRAAIAFAADLARERQIPMPT